MHRRVHSFDQTSSIDWKAEIVTGVRILQRREEVDPNYLWEYHLPEVRATLEEVKNAEDQLGFQFPEDYRDFLLHANGWKCFYQYVDILPLCDLLNTSDVHRSIMYNVELMLEYEPAEGEWLDPKNLLPIAASTHNIDTFVLIKPGNPNAGTIVWLSGDEIDRFPSFHEFYLSMLDYNRLEVRMLKEELEAGEG